MKKDTFLNNKGKRILFIVSAFLLLYLVSYIIDPYSPCWKNYFTRDIPDIIIDWSISLLFCFLVSETSIYIGLKLNRYIQWTEKPSRRLLIETSLNLLAVILIHLLTNSVFTYYYGDSDVSMVTNSIEKNRGDLQWLVVSTIIALMIMAINIGNYLILNWKNEAVKTAELNQLVIEAELQSLKLQIDPHFVFNNLSVLSELILENQQLGYEYAENFSKIYRYMLVNSKKDTILLEDELKFLNSYMFLIKHRVGEGVSFCVEVDKESRRLSMPPLTLQLLVENALKHNKTSKKDPLQIRIYNTDDCRLIVENALLPIEKPLNSSGIGIKNIIRRYKLLSEKEPEIIKDDTSFKVIIPLIKL